MSKISISVSALFLVLAGSSPAYAYLDPGSISLALQALLGGIAGIAVTYRFWLFKLKSFLFGSKFQTDSKNNDNDNDNDTKQPKK